MTTDTRSFSDMANGVFDRCVADYHVTDNIDAPVPAPYPAGSLAATLYAKCWIDAAQWHMEDIVRDPDIDPVERAGRYY